jgi:type II secretory pathway pseudopilin PulG
VELVVAVAIVAALVAVLFPRFLGLLEQARLRELRQDALSVGAAVALLQAEGRYDPEGSDVMRLIEEYAGKELRGEVVGLDAEGGFTYRMEIDGQERAVAYDPKTQELREVAPQRVGALQGKGARGLA